MAFAYPLRTVVSCVPVATTHTTNSTAGFVEKAGMEGEGDAVVLGRAEAAQT
jgi:hypothetical protein